MKNLRMLGCAVLALAVLAGCDMFRKDEPDYEDAPLCNGTVSVSVNNPADTRAANLAGDIDRFTATRCDVEGGGYVLVSYHGRNKEQIGMVQVVRASDGKVVSELSTLDARVNYAIYRKDLEGNEVAYVGVDRSGADGMLCGIIAVPMENYRFVKSSDVDVYTPYKVDGQSVNCIKTFSGNNSRDVVFVAAGGNEALGAEGKAGFTKFSILPGSPTRLSLMKEYTSANYRGYWFSYDILSSCPIAYTYRTVEGGNLVYKVGMIKNSIARTMLEPDGPFFGEVPATEAVVHTKEGTTTDLGRFGVSTFVLGGSSYVVVSTGSKEGGVQVFRHVGDTDELLLVDTWNKACGNTSSLYSGEDGRYYIFASNGEGGVVKLEIIRDPETRAVRLEPVAKRVTNVLTESGTKSSTNYVQLIGRKVYVAGGYEGYFVLDAESDPQFVPVDKKTE